MQKHFLISLFALFSTTSLVYSQTPGMIYEPATGAGAAILDPNGDGYTSVSTAGFTSDDQLESEIPFSSLIFPGSEPTSDLNNAPDCGFTDFVDQGDRDPAQKYLSPAGNWLFRFRMGSISPNAKSYSILIDTDGLFGNTGANADPDWTVDNPGFEIELVLATKFGVFVYDVNTPNCTPVISYPGTTNYQKSIAGSMNCGDLDYFLDFYVVFADLVAQFPGLNVSTPMRYVIVDNTAAQASTICQPSSASDVGGVGQCATLSACFTEIINAQAFCSPNTSVCTYRSDCPTITLPIANGATSVSGTSTEASGTTIKVYKNGVQIGTTTVGVGGAWTLSGISPALVNGNVITATATATGEYESLSDCNSYTIITCTGIPVAAPVVNNETGKNFCGTGLVGYDINVMYPNNTEFTPNPVISSYLPVPTSGSWVWKCTGNTGGCNSGSGVDCIPEGGYMIYQEGPDGCLSYPAFVCLSIGGGYSPVTSPTPSIVAASVTTGSTSVGVTVTFNAAPSPQGGYVHLFLNGMPYAVSSYISSAGTVNISCPALPGCATLTAYFVQSTSVMTDAHDCYSAASTAVIVAGGASTPPVINGQLCITSNLTSVSGTSVEANGTSVQLYVNSVATGAPVLVNNGTWTVTGLNIASGSMLTATATASCESVSALSTAVTVTSQSANTGLTITTSPVFEQGTTLSGTGTNGTQVQVYIDGFPIGSPVTVSGGVWTLSGIQSYELYPYGLLTATSTSAGGCPSVPVTGATVQCILPLGSLTVNPASAEFCAATGTVSVQISNSQTGVVYQLFLADGITETGSSLMGNGGTLTLTSGTLSASTTLKVKAFKLPPGACFIFETDEVPVSFGTNPTLNLAVSASPSVVCSGGSTTITIANSQVGFFYQLRNNADNSLVGTAVVGTGSNITINTGTVASTTTYNVLVTGPAPTLCSGQLTNTVSLTVNSNPTANAGLDQTVCSGTPVTLSGIASGGTGPYVYIWNNSVTNNTAFTPLSTNTYTLTATDAIGCSSQDVVIVIVNPTPSAPMVNTTAATCSAAGTATISNYSGSLTYTFTPATAGITVGGSGLISGLTAGTSYTLTEGNGSCTSATSSSFNIAAQFTIPVAPTASVTTQPTCTAPTGTIVVTAPTGANIQYSVNGTTYQVSGTFSGLAPGSYNVTAQDMSTGCISSATALTVNAVPGSPVAPTASVTTQPTCTAPTGTILVTAPTGANIQYSVNGTTYQVSGTFSGLAPGSYNVTAQDMSTGCISSATALTVNAVPGAPVAPTASVTTQPTCTAPTGTIVVTAPTGANIQYSVNGTTYQVSGTFSGLAPGSYNVTAQDMSTGCISSATALTVNAVPGAPVAPTASVTTQPTCTAPTGTIVVTAPTGANIQYSVNGTTYQVSGTFSGLAPGSYNVTAQDMSTGCVSSATALTVNAVPGAPVAPTASVTTQPTCTAPTGTIVVTAPTGANIQYSVNGTTYQVSGTFSGLAPGSYNVTAQDMSTGCISSATALTVNAVPGAPVAPTASVTTQPTCTAPTGTIVVTAPTGANIQYSVNGTTYQVSGTFSGLAPGSYNVTAQDMSTGCVSSATALTVNAVPGAPVAPTASVTTQPTCTAPTGTIVVTAPTGANIQYSVNGTTYQVSGTFSGLAPGSYNVTAQDMSTGCISSATALTVNAVPGAPVAPTASVTTQPTCTAPTGTIVVTAPTGANIQYSVNGTTYQVSGTFSGLAPGSYNVTAQDMSTGCISSATALTVNAVPGAPVAPTASVTTQPTCTAPTGTIVVTAPTGANIQYSVNGTTYQVSGTFSGLAPGSYNVTAQDMSTGCISSATALTVNAVPGAPVAPTASVTTQPTCTAPTGTIVVTAPTGANIQYSVNGTTYQVSGTFSGLAPGSYNVTAQDMSTGCISSATALTVNAVPGAPVAPTASVTTQPTCTAPTGTIVVTAPTGANIQYSVNGTTYQVSGTFSGLAPGSYNVTAQDMSTGCVSSATALTVNAVPGAPVAPTASVTTQPTCTAPTGTIVVTAPTGANIQYSVNGTTYQVSGTFSGLAPGSYNVTAQDMSTGCVSSATALTVNAVPGAPVAPTASVTTQPTCTAPTGTIVVTAPTGANIQYSVNGTTYQVSGTFSGLAPGSYNVTAQDMSTGCISSATALTVNAVPGAPVAPTASVTTQPTCTAPTGTIVVTAPTGANIQYSVNGTTYQVSGTFSGLAPGSYNVTAQDMSTGCVSSATALTVNAVPNCPPVANDDVASTIEDSPVTIDVTNNDTDTDGSIDDASVTIVTNPTNGTVTVNPTTGEVTYTPNAGFNGTDSFTYSICDNGTPLPAQCDQATVTVTVTAVNDGPVVDNDSNTINEDSGPATGDLTDTGDFDPDGTTLTVNTTPVEGPTNGNIVINLDGTYSYTPNPGFNGNDTIIVSVCDNGNPLPAICINDTLVIIVLPINDAPNANTDNVSTNEDVAIIINVITNDTDSDGNIDESSLIVVDQPTNGTVTVNSSTGQITYTPNNGFTGTDTLIYQVCDDGTPLPALCDTAVVIITVLPCGTDLTADCDGDGVTNGEEVDPDGDGTPGPNGTNPSDPCSFNVADQDLATVSQAWLDADCDGDGVTNGEEVDPDGDGTPGPNGTNPSDPCSFNVTDQDLATVSQAWLVADCDGDGVTNGEEVDPDGDGTPGPNGTNPSDPCSFNVTDQDLATVSQAWLDADCDGDGVTNGEEVDPDGDGTAGPNGTDPSDPCSFNSADQDLATVSQAWLDADCDGDGVTNGEEVDPDGDGTPGPNGTNPSDPCSFNVADQDLATVSQAWLDADCDGDGVTNGDEIDPDGDGTPGPNGTDPSDPCSLNLADQTVTPSQAWLDADCDGDGVTNGDEIDPDGDGTPGPNGTDPSDPCSFNVADQDLATVSQAWLDADCDGDGVTNGEEVDPDGDGTAGPNGTNPSDPCSFNVADQDLATVSQAWLDADCDGDGVTNGEEVDPDGDGTAGPNGTDPNDPCSFNLEDQTLTPSQSWLDTDCDGDGLTNGEELTGGSDPLDPCDPNPCDTDISIPEAFTPDGDNTNDNFVIPGIENYPKNKLTFFNRWGNEVFFAEGYDNSWDGTANRGLVIGDSKLPTATYYYILDLNGDGESIYKGYVYLKR